MGNYPGGVFRGGISKGEFYASLISGIQIPQILYFPRFPQCSILFVYTQQRAVKTKQVISIMADIYLNNADVSDILNEIIYLFLFHA